MRALSYLIALVFALLLLVLGAGWEDIMWAFQLAWLASVGLGRALVDSGIRAVHASGAPQAGDWDHQWPQDLERLKKRYFASDDQLVTLRMFSGLDRDNWMLARRLGLRITTEFNGPRAAEVIEPFFVDKMVGPDNTFNHCGALPESTWQHIRDVGVSVNVCPRSDSQYGLGEGIPGYDEEARIQYTGGLSEDTGEGSLAE